MKSLLPSMRNKKRYIAFEIFSPNKISKHEVVKSIIRELKTFHGENLTSEFGIWVLDYNEKDKTGYLVCNHKYKAEVITGLTLITTLEGVRASFQVLGVSGTIKALKRKFLKDDTEKSQIGKERIRNAINTKHGI